MLGLRLRRFPLHLELGRPLFCYYNTTGKGRRGPALNDNLTVMTRRKRSWPGAIRKNLHCGEGCLDGIRKKFGGTGEQRRNHMLLWLILPAHPFKFILW